MKIIDKIKGRKVIGLWIMVVLIFIIMAVFWINKSTFAFENKTNSLSITCPSVVSSSEEIECKIIANVSDENILSIKADYEFDTGMEYISFETDGSCLGDDCFEVEKKDELGFSVINNLGIKDNILLGYVKFSISSLEDGKNNYNFGLVNIEYRDSEGDIKNIPSINSSIRIKSSVATLDNIILDRYKLNEEFDKNRLNYTANVSSNVEEVIIGYVKTDINSSVSGTGTVGEKISLHYGTNTFLFEVLSEDGKNSNTYVLSVYRDYDFKTDIYKYSDKGIYVGNDTDEVIINNLGLLDNDLMYRITDNKLEIMYGEEVIKSIDILRFSSQFYILDKNIYINRDLTYLELIDKIKSDKLSFKVVDTMDQEITDQGMVINESNKLYIYNLDELIDTYTFKIEYLNFDSSLVIDSTKKIIMKIPAGTTYNDLFRKIDTSKEIDKISNDGKEISNASNVKTGDKIVIHLNGNDITYKLSVLGDVTGDGIIEINDVGRLYRYYNGRVEHLNIHYSKENDDEEFLLAGDVVVDGMIEINDVGRLYRYFNGRINELEVRK